MARQTKEQREEQLRALEKRATIAELALYLSNVFKPDAEIKRRVFCTKDRIGFDAEIRLYACHRADSGIAIIRTQSDVDQVPSIDAIYCMDLRDIGEAHAEGSRYEIAQIFRDAHDRAESILRKSIEDRTASRKAEGLRHG